MFQRTASYSVPAAQPAARRTTRSETSKTDYADVPRVQQPHADRDRLEAARSPRCPRSRSARKIASDVYEARWEEGGLPFLGAFIDLLFNPEANDTAAEFVRGKIHEIVHDPAVAELLSPRTVIGCKRLCVDTGYFETFNRPNVHLVDVSDDADRARSRPHGLRVGDREFELDAIVFATGFDAMTGALLSIDIRGATADARCATPGRPAPAPTSGSARSGSRTSSRSRVRAARRCSPT